MLMQNPWVMLGAVCIAGFFAGSVDLQKDENVSPPTTRKVSCLALFKLNIFTRVRTVNLSGDPALELLMRSPDLVGQS